MIVLTTLPFVIDIINTIGMISDNIDNNLDSYSVSSSTKSLKLVLGSKSVWSNLRRIAWTIESAPLCITGIILLCRRCLYGSETSVLDALQRCLDVSVLPIKAVEDCSLLDGLHLGERCSLPSEHEGEEKTEFSENFLHIS